METRMRRLVRIVAMTMLGAVQAGLVVWGGLVLYYSPVLPEPMRPGVAAAWALFGLAGLVAFGFRRRRKWAMATILGATAIIAFAFGQLQPSNDRDWQRDVAVLPSATIDGDRITIRNIRNNAYRSETDFEPRYYDRVLDLRRLESVDLIAVYWMGDAIAHTMLSFGFGDDDFLTVSIEARKEKSEGYSAIAGFFRNYELIYIVADERDVIGLRANHRHNPPEDVYLYRLQSDPNALRRVFLDYMRTVENLRHQPAWYNSATNNCTGNIWLHATVNPGHVPFSWKILLSGYLPEYLFDMHRLVPNVPFSTLREKGWVNARAHGADQSGDFSRRIRMGVPGYDEQGRPREGAIR